MRLVFRKAKRPPTKTGESWSEVARRAAYTFWSRHGHASGLGPPGDDALHSLTGTHGARAMLAPDPPFVAAARRKYGDRVADWIKARGMSVEMEVACKPAPKGVRAFSPKPEADPQAPGRMALAPDGTYRGETGKNAPLTGKVAEAIIAGYLRMLGFADVAKLAPGGRSNFPVDLVTDHLLIEAKGGSISNSVDARKWRITIGGKPQWWKAKEDELRKRGDFKEIRRMNEQYETLIMALKQAAPELMTAGVGKKVRVIEMATIFNMSTGVADIFMFDRVEKSINWSDDRVGHDGRGSAYAGSVQFEVTDWRDPKTGERKKVDAFRPRRRR